MALCFASKMFSQATTVDVTGTGSTLTITNAVQTPVDPLLTITADGDLTAFTVTISGSYTAGDILSYTGGLPSGITAAAFNTTTRSLVFSGYNDCCQLANFVENSHDNNGVCNLLSRAKTSKFCRRK